MLLPVSGLCGWQRKGDKKNEEELVMERLFPVRWILFQRLRRSKCTSALVNINISKLINMCVLAFKHTTMTHTKLPIPIYSRDIQVVFSASFSLHGSRISEAQEVDLKACRYVNSHFQILCL